MALPEDNETLSHLDVAWIAVDRKGQIGVFTTGGSGPIPKIYLRNPAALDQVISAIWALPTICGYDLFTRVPRPDDFIGFAQRGLFSFDWTDVHRTHDLIDAYEIQARPTAPATVQTVTWPSDLADLLKSVTSNALDFDEAKIRVLAALDCAAQPTIAAHGASRRR